MSLRARLLHLERSGCLEVNPARKAAPKRSLEALLPGEAVENKFGAFYRHQQRVELATPYGPRSLLGALTLPCAELVSLYASLEGICPERVLYLDTETTGLSGGSGTYAFMVGVAWFDQGELRLEQLIMREHAEEKALLEYLRPLLEDTSGLVTFNGKSFDAQLLQTRFMMNRLRVCFEDMPHLDLLHLCRRIWGAGLVDCRLETLEEAILGLPRHDDVPGWMVPQIYFRFLRGGDARGLAGVAEHNRRDLMSMVGLVSVLSHHLSDPLAFREPIEDVGLARLYEDLGQEELARELAERALDWPLPRPARRACMLRLARLRRRAGDRDGAAALWRDVLKEHPEDAEACEELAKHLEHQRGDYQLALRLVERTLRTARLTPGRRRSFLSRRERLRRRLEGSGA
ncbi:MAG: ribonuclease H-like domain-containing protein [Vulcanimicrobiota bacterium]